MLLMETFFHEFGFRISILFKIDGRQKINPVWISGTLNFALDLMSLFVTGKGPFLSQERLQLGKDSSILGKDPFPGKILSQNWWILSQFATGKGPFLSQLQTGKAWKGERKAFRSNLVFSHAAIVVHNCSIWEAVKIRLACSHLLA